MTLACYGALEIVGVIIIIIIINKMLASAPVAFRISNIVSQ